MYVVVASCLSDNKWKKNYEIPLTRGKHDWSSQLYTERLKAVAKLKSKKNQAWMGFQPTTSVIPVQCSTKWAIKPTGSWSCCEFVHYIQVCRWQRREYVKELISVAVFILSTSVIYMFMSHENRIKTLYLIKVINSTAALFTSFGNPLHIAFSRYM